MRLYAATIPHGEKALEHETAYALLARALQYEHLPEICRSTDGKPHFSDASLPQFNLSHCRGLAVCGIAKTALGVDCEKIRPLREGVLRRSFSPEEQAAVRNSANPDEMFFRLWTLKESFVKALGIGISYPLHTAVFALDGDTVTAHPNGWQFCQFRLDGGYLAACCVAHTESLPKKAEFL